MKPIKFVAWIARREEIDCDDNVFINANAICLDSSSNSRARISAYRAQ